MLRRLHSSSRKPSAQAAARIAFGQLLAAQRAFEPEPEPSKPVLVARKQSVRESQRAKL